MKVAVFTSFLDNIGGAEIVALTMARHLGADVYTTNINPGRIRGAGFADVLPRIRSIGRVPVKAPFRHQLTSLRFRLLKLKGYDHFIIAGDWAVSAAVRNKPCLWYVHSPLNELFAFRRYVRDEMLPLWMRPFFDAWSRFNAWLAKRYARHVDRWTCNSENTRRRIRKYFRKRARIIHPPTDVSAYRDEGDHGFWLSVNRLSLAKRVHLQLEAFRKLPGERLVIVGSYEEGARQFEAVRRQVEELKPANVTVRHWVSDEDLKRLYATCKGFITTAKDEDFGMTPVEAMASGKPVIAPAEGGYLETVVDGETGVLVRRFAVDKLVHAVMGVGRELSSDPGRYRDACRRRAELFDTVVFAGKLKEELSR